MQSYICNDMYTIYMHVSPICIYLHSYIYIYIYIYMKLHGACVCK